MRAADVIARRLSQAGVRYGFGIAGGEILTLIDALAGEGIEFVAARHETAAGLMAEGAAAHDGAPALLVVTVGPGVSNAVNAIANASLDRVPMIVLSGAVDRAMIGSYTHQVFDECALLSPITKASVVAEPGCVDEMLQDALALAMRHPRGPVHVALPVSLAEAQEPYGSCELRTSVRAAAVTDAQAPLARALEQAAQCLARAQRPLLIAGLEAVDREVAHELVLLQRALAVPVLTTYKAKGVIDERDGACVGAIGLSPRADAIVAPLIAAADVVLLVGYDPVEMRASYRQPFAATTTVIELAACPRTHGMHAATLELVGELAASLRALRSRTSMPRERWPDAHPAQVRRALRDAFAPTRGFGPQRVAQIVVERLPDGVRATIDTGAHRILLSQVLSARRPGQFLQSNGLCTMGYAVPAAIGLAHASGRPVVALTGDGGFEMIMSELATLRDLALPVTIVVFDDQSLALIDLKQHQSGLQRRAVWSGATDHVAIARAFGGHGARVGTDAALCRELDAALQRTGFSVISCALERGAYAGQI